MAARASSRLRSRASLRVTVRLSMSASRVASWQLKPGTSSIHPIHHAPSCLTTAVSSLFASRPLPLRPSVASAGDRLPSSGGRGSPVDRAYPRCVAGAARPPGRPAGQCASAHAGRCPASPAITAGRSVSGKLRRKTKGKRPLEKSGGLLGFLGADARNRTEDPSMRVPQAVPAVPPWPPRRPLQCHHLHCFAWACWQGRGQCRTCGRTRGDASRSTGEPVWRAHLCCVVRHLRAGATASPSSPRRCSRPRSRHAHQDDTVALAACPGALAVFSARSSS